MKVYYNPDYKKNNNGLVDALLACGCEILDNNYSLYRIDKILQTDLFVFNWFENIYKGPKGLVEFLKRIIILMIIKICRKKVMFCIHNRQPHIKNYEKPNIILSHILLLYIITLSDYVIMLSKKTIESFSKKDQIFLNKKKAKFFYLPHRDFSDLYIESNLNTTKANELRMLFLGPAEVYKNPELLIKVMNRLCDKPIYLTFEGKCDSFMKEKLQLLNKNKNVLLNFSYIPDKNLASEFSKYDICIYPLSLDCCINSSSVLLAWSLHKSVVCSEVSTLQELPSCLNYGYSYETINEHEEKLYKTILKVYEEKNNNPLVLRQKGDKCAELLHINNNQEMINKIIKEILHIKDRI